MIDRRTLLRQLVKLEEQIRELTAEHRLLGRKLESAEKLLGFLDEARMGLPNLEDARRNANQVAAVATLRNIVSAQAQLQQSGKIDLDQDGTGEYAGFVEMSGAGNGRMYGTLVPEVLSGAFRVLDKRGRVSRSGYHFRLYVPGKNGRPIGEPQRGFTKDMGIDAELSERAWCAYAWPVSSKSGGEVLFMGCGGL